MDLKILEERPNPLLERTEYRFRADHATASTPTRETVRAELAKMLKVPKDRLIVERMNARFGTPVTEGVAVAYQTVEARDRLVREHILIRNKLKEKAAPATPGAAAPETPAPAAPAAEKPKA